MIMFMILYMQLYALRKLVLIEHILVIRLDALPSKT
jgi:hypothetical protein